MKLHSCIAMQTMLQLSAIFNTHANNLKHATGPLARQHDVIHQLVLKPAVRLICEAQPAAVYRSSAAGRKAAFRLEMTPSDKGCVLYV